MQLFPHLFSFFFFCLLLLSGATYYSEQIGSVSKRTKVIYRFDVANGNSTSRPTFLLNTKSKDSLTQSLSVIISFIYIYYNNIEAEKTRIIYIWRRRRRQRQFTSFYNILEPFMLLR